MILAHKEYGFQLGNFTPEHEATGWKQFEDLQAAKDYVRGVEPVAPAVATVPEMTPLQKKRGRPAKGD